MSGSPSSLNSSTPITVIRNVVALVAAVAWVAWVPVHGMPFGGCDVNGFATLEPGCSHWPEFARGFGFVLISLVIARDRAWLSALVVFLLVVLAVFDQIKTNGFLLVQSFADFLVTLSLVFPILLGGLVAFGIYAGVRQITGGRKESGAV